jgi:enoyl-CoA hydratase/carnithine racemase
VRKIIGSLLNQSEEELIRFTRMTCDLIWNMRMLSKPVIACLNGITAGAGAMIAIASDFRIASEAARIGFVFVRVGLSGADMGACYLLPKLIGLAHSTDLLMTGKFIDADEAHRIGLYNKVVPSEQLSDATMELAAQLAAGPANGIQSTKQQLNAETLADLKQALDAEATVQAQCMKNADFREGFQAFMEKREPKFR